MAPITLSALHGQTITFSLYKDGVLVQAGLAMTEIGSLGEFYADMPTGSADGKYLVCFFDGANKIASGVIYWANGVEVLPAPEGLLTLAEIESSTVLAKVTTAMTLDAAYDAAKTAAQQSSLSALGDDVVTLGSMVMDLPTLEEIEATTVLAKASDVTAVPASVRTELATELAHLDADVSSRSALTAEQVWTNPDRTLTETPGLPSGQAEQLRKVAQLHGIGAELVVTETARTAGDVSQTITTTEEQTTVSAA